MFSSARTGWPAATWPTSGSPFGETTDFTASTTPPAAPAALSSISIARGFEGTRRSRPTFSRLDRCACTVEDEASPTALPMSRTVGGYPYLAEYRLMNSKISCWRLVRLRSTTRSPEWPGRTCVRQGSGGCGRNQGGIRAVRTGPDTRRILAAPRLARAPVAELVDAQG